MKFARYLEDNCTPEWKRAYIDYRRLKKCIKVIQQRRQQGGQENANGGGGGKDKRRRDVEEGRGDPATAEAEEEQQQQQGGSDSGGGSSGKDRDDDGSSDDDDHGPHAPPRPPLAKRARAFTWKAGGAAAPNAQQPSPSPSAQPNARRNYGSTQRTPPAVPRGDQAPPPLALPDAAEPNGGGVTEPQPALMEEWEEDGRRPRFTSSPSSSISGNGGANASDEARAGPSRFPDSPSLLSRHSPRDEPPSSQRSRQATAASQRGTPRMDGRSPRLQAVLGRMMNSPLQVGTDPARRKDAPIAATTRGGKDATAAAAAASRYPHDLDELYSDLLPDEAKFFSVLDEQLDKVESFYHEREGEAHRRWDELKLQLKELAEHRRIFHDAEEREQAQLGNVRRMLPESLGRRIPFVTGGGAVANGSDGTGAEKPPRRSLERNNNNNNEAEFNPEKYQRYKKKLRVAMLEYYRQLEILKNYRILNLTGFKKALKKFEKTAQLRSLDLYMSQKVEHRSFSHGKELEKMIKAVEDEYTLRFENGNHKKAVIKLRGQLGTVRTHHWSTFLSGAYIGVGLPPFVLAIVLALDPYRQRLLPQWNALLEVYATFFLPVLFGMLFQLNLSAYVAARINYTFIMEIDLRTAIDYRQFLEIPALLFAVLGYCMFFSFYRVGEPAITPFAWPMVWLIFAVVFFLNPVPVYYQHARYWLISVLGRVFTPGYSRVEFIAFFVADELNSLVYPLSNLWFIGCAYNKHWPSDTYSACPTGGNWVHALLLVIPGLIRLIQCLKRYKDSRLSIHLINAGKYLSVIIQYSLFSVWRSRGSVIGDPSFAVWATFAAISSCYTSSWDLIVDWGLLRPQHAYLRESLGYSSRLIYYQAMVTNVIIRFVWVWYIPQSTLAIRPRSFFFALLEMLRRWQWNFFRVETEQVGNTDQYRVTREIPLPYRRMASDDEEDQLERQTSSVRTGYGIRGAAVKLGDLRQRLTRERSNDRTVNAGPMGDLSAREYEPRRRQRLDERDVDEMSD